MLNKLSEKDIKDLLQFIDTEFKNEQEYAEIIDFVYELDNAPEKIVEEPKPTWTEWRIVNANEVWKIMNELKGNHYVIQYLKEYLKDAHWYMYTRNNGKKTDVKLSIGFGNTVFKSTSTCNKHFDDFDESKGIQVALIKIFPKLITYFAHKYITKQY